MSHSTALDVSKIRLDSVEDLEYLRKGFDDYVRNVVIPDVFARRDPNQALPGGAQAEIQLGTVVEAATQAWSEQVWKLVSQNILINGLDIANATSSESSAAAGAAGAAASGNGSQAMKESECSDIAQLKGMEPFDEKLDAEVRQLQQEADEMMLRLTELRKRTPAQIEQLTRSMLDSQAKADAQYAEHFASTSTSTSTSTAAAATATSSTHATLSDAPNEMEMDICKDADNGGDDVSDTNAAIKQLENALVTFSTVQQRATNTLSRVDRVRAFVDDVIKDANAQLERNGKDGPNTIKPPSDEQSVLRRLILSSVSGGGGGGGSSGQSSL
ncbi:hypothetical protein GQ42DRAFT_160600 [Ramicandelaber brevisporus]|nr:hypothetical protein GQ42DRAFT_160600 [Ramicandelaber brevisporus]